VLPLIFYDQSTTQWLVHDEYKKDSCKYTHIVFYHIDLGFYEYKVEEYVHISTSSFTKNSNINRSMYDHHTIESNLGIEEHISKVDSSKNVISAPAYGSYEGSDEEFHINELFSFVLKDIKLDNSEQELVENFQCDEVGVLPPFYSSESQTEKSKSIEEHFSQLNHEEGISSFVEKFVISHIFHDAVAFWLEFALSNISNDFRYMMLIFSDHKYKLHNHFMLQFPLLLVLFLQKCIQEVQPCSKELSWYQWMCHFT